MTSPFTILRVVAVLRRVAKALERANQLAETRLECEFPKLALAKTHGPKLVKIDRPSAADWNAAREREREESMVTDA